MASKVMAWSKCQIEIAKVGVAKEVTEGEVQAQGNESANELNFLNIGTIKDKSSTLEAQEGESLEAIATGGERVAKETLEGGYTLTTRVIEPSNDLLKELGLGEVNGNDFKIKTHVVSGSWAVNLTPKNDGAIGIKAPLTNVSYKPGWSEEEGNYADLVFDILKGENDYWYSRFVKAAPATGSGE